MTDKLRDDLAIHDVDGFYQALVAAYDGLDDEQTRLMNARLILLLANQIGARDVLDEALRVARQAVDRPPDKR